MIDIMGLILKKQVITQADYNEYITAYIQKLQNATEEDIRFYKNSIEGGNCTHCKKPWQQVEIKNTVADYKTWNPACDCYEKEEKRKRLQMLVKKICKDAAIPKLYTDATITGMNLKILRDDTRKAIAEVNQYLDEKRYKEKGLILFGDIGAGKTHIAVSVLKCIAVRHKKRALFVPVSELISETINSQNKYIREIVRRDIVLLDDMDKLSTGKLKTKNEWIGERIFSLIDSLVSNRKIIIGTTNCASIKDFQSMYDMAVVSRLIDACDFISVKGDDYRLKRVKK